MAEGAPRAAASGGSFDPAIPLPHRIIGVIGGMGPAATVEFMRRIIEATPAQDDCDHIHLVVDQNPKIPSRLGALAPGGATSPEAEIVRAARSLESAGATLLAMPCNTAHAYAPAITAAVAIPFLNLVDLAAARMAAIAPGGRIGVLASPATAWQGLFDAAFAAAGLRIWHWRDEPHLAELILAIKANGASPPVVAEIQKIASRLAEGCDALLVACTEFSLAAPMIEVSCPIHDALDILVDAVVSYGTGCDRS